MTTLALHRVTGLARANVLLLLRNRLTMVYAVVLPLLPLGLLLLGGTGNDGRDTTPINTVLLLALVFPVYYNVLSQVVGRRDELVLKRLRTGEARDSEILLSIALPGAAIALAVALVAVPLGVALGMPVPTNLLLYVVGVLASCAMFAAFAFWTAAWTRNAEAAQMTSVPVILLAGLGNVGAAFPHPFDRITDLTPTGALGTLVDAAWTGDGFLASWGAAGQPLLVLVLWTVLALELARRSMRWEPRS